MSRWLLPLLVTLVMSQTIGCARGATYDCVVSFNDGHPESHWLAVTTEAGTTEDFAIREIVRECGGHHMCGSYCFARNLSAAAESARQAEMEMHP